MKNVPNHQPGIQYTIYPFFFHGDSQVARRKGYSTAPGVWRCRSPGQQSPGLLRPRASFRDLGPMVVLSMVHGWPEMEIEAPWKKTWKGLKPSQTHLSSTKPILLCHKNSVSRHHHLNPSILLMFLPPYKNQTQDLRKQMFIEENGQRETHCFLFPARIYKTTPALNPNVHPATGGLMNLHLKPKSMEHLKKIPGKIHVATSFHHLYHQNFAKSQYPSSTANPTMVYPLVI